MGEPLSEWNFEAAWAEQLRQDEAEVLRVVADASTSPAPGVVLQDGSLAVELVLRAPGQPDRVLYNSDAAFLRSIGVQP